MSDDSSLHGVTRDLLVAVDRLVASTASAPTRIPQWVFDGGEGPDARQEEDAFSRCTLPVSRALFDDTLAVALWHDFWTLVEQVGALVERIGSVSFVRPPSLPVSSPFQVSMRPVMLGPQPPGVVAASVDDALTAVVLCRMSSTNVRNPHLSGTPGSSENLVGLVALAWMRSMLERGLMTVLPEG